MTKPPKKKKTVLLVGLEYSGASPRGIEISTKGLCRPQIEPELAAAPLYEYDLIIINPVSYSHFIFGRPGPHSNSEKELWDLKRENNHGSGGRLCSATVEILGKISAKWHTAALPAICRCGVSD
jgi:hypothetical protein